MKIEIGKVRPPHYCVNFLPSGYYAACKKTVEENGDDTDEIAAGGLNSEPCKTINADRIREAIMSFECTLTSSQDITGQGNSLMFIGQVQLAAVEENCHRLENICGTGGFMYNIPSPQNPVNEERMPTAAAYLIHFIINE